MRRYEITFSDGTHLTLNAPSEDSARAEAEFRTGQTDITSIRELSEREQNERAGVRA